MEQSGHLNHMESISDAEDYAGDVPWRPIKYSLKLGLRGWIVKEMVVDPQMDEEERNVAPEDLHDPHEDQHKDQFKNKLSHLKNPDVEESEQDLFSGIEILHSRLASIGAGFDLFQIKASPGIVKPTFTRNCLAQTFGGSTIATFSNVQMSRLPPSLGCYKAIRFMCLNALYNAHCPQKPGAPGLYYALRDPSRWPADQEIVFTRYGSNRWNFMGIYSITKSYPLSAAEFQSLSSKVQETWFSNIWTHKWGNYTLAAIYLRMHMHREPDNVEVEHYAKKKAALIHGKVTSGDVRQAFLNGDEKVNVWIMRCVGYDEKFKKKLLPAQPTKQTKRKAIEAGESSRVTKKKRI